MSELIQFLLVKTMANFYKIGLWEKSLFSFYREKKCILHKKGKRKKSYCEEKIIISAYFSGDMAAAHVIANTLYF